MKTVFTFLTLVFFLGACCSAQVKNVRIGVNGLTCSQCSRSVELSLRKLDFVRDVTMNLEQTEGLITFNNDTTIDFEYIAQAVVDAGFSVRSLKAEIKMYPQMVPSGQCLSIPGGKLLFLAGLPGPSEQIIIVTLIGRRFMSKAESKPWRRRMNDTCGSTYGKLYFVTR